MDNLLQRFLYERDFLTARTLLNVLLEKAVDKEAAVEFEVTLATVHMHLKNYHSSLHLVEKILLDPSSIKKHAALRLGMECTFHVGDVAG